MEYPSNKILLLKTTFINVFSSPLFIRWSTPQIEVNLCRHVTLASARVLFDKFLPNEADQIILDSKRGKLKAKKTDN